MQAQDIYKRCCLAAVAATFFCTARGAVYEDSLLSVDKGTVVRHLTDKGIVYVFTATNDTTVTLKQSATLDAALVVGGGGSGGSPYGGGGGGGGVVYRESFANSSFAADDTIALKVGAGGPYETAVSHNGEASWLQVNGETVTAYGGGHGGYNGGVPGEGLLGSGGGSGVNNSAHTEYTNGVHYTSGQGFPGGCGRGYMGSAGGGGASEAGVPISASVNPGKGGEGMTNDITGVAEVYGSGGGAYPIERAGRSDYGRGGTNAGDGARVWNAVTAQTSSNAGTLLAISGGGCGRPGFGGGGGGASDNNETHGAGGSGTVILRFAYPEGSGKLIVQHDNAGNGQSCTPEAGEYVLEPGAQRTLTASSGAVSGEWRWTQVGYALSESADGGATWSVPETNYSHRVDFVQKGSLWTRVTWLWRNEQVEVSNGMCFSKDAGVAVSRLGEGYLVTCTNVSGRAVDIVFKRKMNIKRTLVVGGGGAGGRSAHGSGGGGGGGVLAQDDIDALVEPGNSFLVRVGAGGAAPTQNNTGANGESSTLWDGMTLTEAYGGGGGSGGSAGAEPGTGPKIASGGGLPCNGNRPTLFKYRVGLNHVHYTWGQGWPAAPHSGDYGNGGGGGGAGGWGTAVVAQSYAGNGGEGITNDISGVAQVYGSGGGGSSQSDRPGSYEASLMAVNGLGGTNAGMGNDRHTGGREATSGVDGFGGGGGAACGSQPSGKGGSGVVMFYCEPIAGFVLVVR